MRGVVGQVVGLACEGATVAGRVPGYTLKTVLGKIKALLRIT